MMFPVAGNGTGPPSQYALNVLPRIKMLMVIIFVCGILRAMSTALREQSSFEGLMDLTSCLFGYFLFRNMGSMGQCSCGFMSMCFLNFVYDSIFAIIWFTNVGTSAFSASGKPIDIRGFSQELSWRFPVTSVLLIILPPLQFYSGYIGYRMFKSMQAGNGMDEYNWSNMSLGQLGMHRPTDESHLEEGTLHAPLNREPNPLREGPAGQGFTPFSGPGQRL